LQWRIKTNCNISLKLYIVYEQQHTNKTLYQHFVHTIGLVQCVHQW
jgi:hypothetical protein